MTEMRVFRNIRTGGLRVSNFPDDPGPDYVEIDEQEGAQMHLSFPAIVPLRPRMTRMKWLRLVAFLLAIFVLGIWVWR